MLLLPRLLRGRLLPVIAATPLLQCRPPQAQAALVPAASPLRRLALACAACLLWPLAALVVCADATGGARSWRTAGLPAASCAAQLPPRTV
jgi:hypothetical protein